MREHGRSRRRLGFRILKKKEQAASNAASEMKRLEDPHEPEAIAWWELDTP
jgi:hypothetical protein